MLPIFDLLIKVLKALEAKQLAAPEPFAQNKQYKKNFEGDGDEQDPEAPAKKSKKSKKKKCTKPPAQVKNAAQVEVHEPSASVSAESAVTYAPHEYSSLRQQFLSEKTLAGMSAKDAREEWNKSDVKRRLLSGVPLPELKRRRFVPKDCQVNPWA